jgi:hypothetical protein
MLQLYSLQLFYYDIAWYLLYKDHSSGQFATGRVDRFSNYCKVLAVPKRGIAALKRSQ